MDHITQLVAAVEHANLAMEASDLERAYAQDDPLENMAGRREVDETYTISVYDPSEAVHALARQAFAGLEDIVKTVPYEPSGDPERAKKRLVLPCPLGLIIPGDGLTFSPDGSEQLTYDLDLAHAAATYAASRWIPVAIATSVRQSPINERLRQVAPEATRIIYTGHENPAVITALRRWACDLINC